ncbi:MAG: hypothetical protein QOJ59_5540 [Thermomicrobiales bacterium]|jgi:hypothetical protein|nr:hypothetical protein [Thermomicrobiales bacterium]
MVVVRFRRDGGSSSEIFTLAHQENDPARPINLLEAFQATGEPYREALRRGREARRELLAAERGVLTGAEVAQLLGLSRQAATNGDAQGVCSDSQPVAAVSSTLPGSLRRVVSCRGWRMFSETSHVTIRGHK